MEIYIIRHGRTVWNEKKLLQGSRDIELNEEGREVAKQLGETLKDIKIDRIYSSPLKRAYETAQLISGGREIEIVTDNRLRELNFGENEGKSVLEIREDETNPFRYFFSQPELYFAPKDGETLEALCKRAREFMEDMIEPHKDEMERVMIVAHGALNKALLCHAKQHGIEEFWSGGLQKNCSATILKLDDEGYHVIEN